VVRFSDICCIKSTSLNPDANSSRAPQERAAAERLGNPQGAVHSCPGEGRISYALIETVGLAA
jgi:hypothetical protein